MDGRIGETGGETAARGVGGGGGEEGGGDRPIP